VSAFDLNALRVDLAAALGAAGLPVALDPRNVSPPTVVVGLPNVVGWEGACVAAVEIDLTPVAPPPGNLDAVESLLDLVAALLGLYPFALARPATLEVGGQLLPAYSITVTTTAKDEG
jgi:hypothetical protein